jgi:hypothetical protein
MNSSNHNNEPRNNSYPKLPTTLTVQEQMSTAPRVVRRVLERTAAADARWFQQHPGAFRRMRRFVKHEAWPWGDGDEEWTLVELKQNASGRWGLERTYHAKAEHNGRDIMFTFSGTTGELRRLRTEDDGSR